LSLPALFKTYIRYEGSPGLWHFLLWVLVHTHVSYTGLHWFCGLVSVAATALLVFGSPFPRYIRLTLPFTYFLIFQFAIVARSYVLVPIFLFLIAFCWKRSPLLLGLLLGMLANIALHAAMISAGFAVVYAVSCLQGKMPGSGFSWRRQIEGLAILLTLYAFAVWTVWPPHDQGFKASNGPLIVVVTLHFMELCRPWGLAIPFWVAIALCLQARRAQLYLLPLLLFALFSLVVHIAFWHAGLLFPLAICLLWITWPSRGTLAPRSEAMGSNALIAMAALQILWSAYALEFDHYHAYSPDLAASEFLQPFFREGATIAVTYTADSGCHACFSVGLMPYFDDNIFINQPNSFWWWSTRNATERNFQQILPSHPSLVVVEAHPIHPDRPIDLQDEKIQQVVREGYRFTNMFCGEMPEGFQLREKSCHLIFRRNKSAEPLLAHRANAHSRPTQFSLSSR
jgi:hypothetical protein